MRDNEKYPQSAAGTVVMIVLLVGFFAGAAWLFWLASQQYTAAERGPVDYGIVVRICSDGTRIIKYEDGHYEAFKSMSGVHRVVGPGACN